MKNTILVSITILAVSFFFIGQTSTKKDFDAEAKYKVLERYLIKLINDKKSSDAKLEKLEKENEELQTSISNLEKDYEKLSKYCLILTEVQNENSTKINKGILSENEKKSPPQSLDWNTGQILDKIRDLEWKLNKFLGRRYTGSSSDVTLEEIKDTLNRKSDSFHFH